MSQKYSKIVIALLPEIIKLLKISDLNYKGIKEAFEKLEMQIGDVNINWTFERIDDPYKTQNYYYLLEESVQKFVKFIGLQPKITITEQIFKIPKVITNVLADLTHQTLVGSKEDLLSLYCRLWETFFNILIGQIYYKLSKDTKKGKFYQVEEVKNFLKNNQAYIPIYKLIRPIDTNIRNAVTHLNYYINTTENSLYYYYTANKERFMKKISLEELEKGVNELLIGNFILILLLGDKMKQEISNEIEKKIEELFEY